MNELAEQYMKQHDFLEADKKKVRDFIKSVHATNAYLTRSDFHYIDSHGVPGVISRAQLGIQNNFV